MRRGATMQALDTPDLSAPAKRSRMGALLVTVALYVSLLSIWPLSSNWSADPQYHFGFIVPVLALIAGMRRWHTRPTPSQPQVWAKPALVVLFLLFLPAWFLLQPNPDWRLLNWVTTTMAAATVIVAAASAGGTTWAKHFAFPALLLLTAVPWPTEIEWPITQGLMRGVAATSAEVLTLCGVTAIANGNLVEIAGGTLGVDIACSGIRSLQPSLMMALFLGELFQFAIGRRVALFIAGIAIAFLCNLARVLLLATVANSQGIAAIDQWHDPAGSVLMTACFALLWGTAVLLERGYVLPTEKQSAHGSIAAPRRIALFGAAWIGLSVIAGEAWFRFGKAATGTPWAFAAPASADLITLDQAAKDMLKFDRGGGWKWKSGANEQWTAFDLIWDPGTARSRMLLSMHRPDVCLAAIGLRLLDDRGVVWVDAQGTRIAFQAYTFETYTGYMHVYYALYRGGEPILGHDESVRNACLKAVAERHRTVDQRVLQLAVEGPSNPKEADAALEKMLAQTILPNPAPQ